MCLALPAQPKNPNGTADGPKQPACWFSWCFRVFKFSFLRGPQILDWFSAMCLCLLLNWNLICIFPSVLGVKGDWGTTWVYGPTNQMLKNLLVHPFWPDVGSNLVTSLLTDMLRLAMYVPPSSGCFPLANEPASLVTRAPWAPVRQSRRQRGLLMGFWFIFLLGNIDHQAEGESE